PGDQIANLEPATAWARRVRGRRGPAETEASAQSREIARGHEGLDHNLSRALKRDPVRVRRLVAHRSRKRGTLSFRMQREPGCVVPRNRETVHAHEVEPCARPHVAEEQPRNPRYVR